MGGGDRKNCEDGGGGGGVENGSGGRIMGGEVKGIAKVKGKGDGDGGLDGWIVAGSWKKIAVKESV